MATAKKVTLPTTLDDLLEAMARDEVKGLQALKALTERTAAQREKGQERLEKALHGVFDTYAPGSGWLPQEFLLSFAVVRLKVSPRAYAATKERVMAVLKDGQGKLWETAKGVGKGVRRLDASSAVKAKRVAKKKG